MTIRVASDVGGTFTDLVYIQDGQIGAVKADTTPPDFETGVLDALQKSAISREDISFFAHGSTVVINALTERKGVKTALITTRGFRDVLEIARGNTPDLYNIYYRKPKPFVRRQLRHEVTERLSHKGEVLTPLAEDEIPAILDVFRAEGVAAIAVCFLHAYANPLHEARTVELIRALWPEVAVIASHEITREWREYERTNTTVLSAYVLPIAQSYIERLEQKLRQSGVVAAPYIMQSNGGISTATAAKANPITLIESGPVSGILGAASYGQLIGQRDLIVLDIGGTTAKCSLIHDGQTRITTEYVLEKTPLSPGYPLRTPVIDIVEIGNGGGSIAWVDSAGSLHVGPQSAGSVPGPVSYGKGGRAPTTTDANLLTGRINPDKFVGGEITPDMVAVERAFTELGTALGKAALPTARGVIQIANANMVNALKLVSVNRGYDPRDYALMAFGGGGAMHAAALAAELNIPTVIIPPHAAVFSAWGMLMIDLRRDLIRTRIQPLGPETEAHIMALFAELEQEALAAFAADGFAADQVLLERFVDARYRGQDHTVKVAIGIQSVAEVIERFHAAHEQEYTFRLDNPVEVVNLHLIAYGLVDKPKLAPAPRGPADATAARSGQRLVDFDISGEHLADLYDRAKLRHGMSFTGPAIVEEAATVTVVPPGARVEVDAFGGLHLFLS
ncbi:hydantoinase/oxoprolinase family protein [Govanella unica]|uniref:Hydantoinase/oxoprolinase family protein n=1 Tax=Govanella unica TaxID=2975056 RepID=A0A9X3TY92_9PROT|nr:hydantoinase/oxoprolinase family protein [Govania unica]MDA5193978.1 hydantoinase/oxoprolinase family protein [Govania unica]